MTRDEASNILDDYDVNFDGHTAEEIAEAFDMAIKALEQEPKIIETIDFAINVSDEGTNYFVGLRNGMRYVKSLIDGEEPQFENCAEQEPKTGQWIIDGHHRKCQNCGEYFCIADAEGNKIPSYFCPNCGARMSEVEQ